MDGSSSNDIATVADAFLTTVQVRASAPAILGADLSVALSWSEYGVAARRGRAGPARCGPGRCVGAAVEQSAGVSRRRRGRTNARRDALLDVQHLCAGAVGTLIRDAGCRIFVTEPALLERLREGLALSGSPVDEVIVVDTPSWTNTLSHSEITHSTQIAGDDIATLIYTSGTTGPPKGVELTHRNILAMTHV